MKRVEAFAPLSRDHHGTLILAQLLKRNAPVFRGLPVNTLGKVAYAQQQFETHIKKHFQQEETILEMVKGCKEKIEVIAEEIKNEHQHLSLLFDSLNAARDIEQAMNTLAVKLEDHIRKEERILFPLLQQYCSEELLQEIHMLLH